MKRLKGPELKMPDLKVPPFLADLYYDMRDRRLLPVVALVAVAIVAVPFLLGDSEAAAPPPLASTGPETGGKTDDPSLLTVVEAKPGLRDYRKRLGRHTPTDPFKQRYTNLPESAQLSSEISSEVSGGEAASETSVTDVNESPGSAQGGTPSGSGKGNQPDSLDGKRLFGFRPTVRFGVAGSGELALHRELPLGSLLPEKNAIVLLTGVVQSGKRALFNVAPGVVVRGDGDCVGGDENCRFLSMREGDAVDLLTGVPGKSYRLKVESIEFVELDLPPKSERASGSSVAKPRQSLVPGLPQNFSN